MIKRRAYQSTRIHSGSALSSPCTIIARKLVEGDAWRLAWGRGGWGGFATEAIKFETWGDSARISSQSPKIARSIMQGAGQLPQQPGNTCGYNVALRPTVVESRIPCSPSV